MWIWMSAASALLLGTYDVAKKQALKRNGVLWVLLGATVLTALFMSPCLKAGPMHHHLMLMAKAALVTLSWVSGLAALKHIPITIASPIKATRPVLVVLFSIILFGERLNVWQWLGVAVVIASMFMMSFSGKKEGIDFVRNKGIYFMLLSVITGAASALYDKVVIAEIEPLFVQSWTNVYISVLLAIFILVRRLVRPERHEKFRWDWTIVLIAVLITAADCLYFFAIKAEGSLLSVISLLRRGSVIVTFVLGALFFKEGNIRSKAVVLGVLLAGLVLLMYGSAL